MAMLVGIVGAVVVGTSVAVVLRRAWRAPFRRITVGPAWSRDVPPMRCPPLRLGEVRIVDITINEKRIVLTLGELINGVCAGQSCVIADRPEPGIVASLEGWCTSGAALLLLTDDRDETHLFAPDGADTALHVLGERRA